MIEPEKFFAWLSTDPGKMALAGALGGLVRWLTLREKPMEGAISFVVGGICALYLGPLVSPLLTPVIGAIAPDGDPVGFSSFVVGIGGTSIASIVITVFQLRSKEVSKDGD